MLPLRGPASAEVIDLDEDSEDGRLPAAGGRDDPIECFDEVPAAPPAPAAAAATAPTPVSESGSLASVLHVLGRGRSAIAEPPRRQGSAPATPPLATAASAGADHPASWLADEAQTPTKAARASSRSSSTAAAIGQLTSEPSPLKRQRHQAAQPAAAAAGAFSTGAARSSGSRGNRPWARRGLAAALDSRREPLQVFLVSVDERQGAGASAPPGGASSWAPVLDLHGVTREGQSVLLHVHGFLPYFYAAPPGIGAASGVGSFKACREALDSVRPSERVVADIEAVERMPLLPYQASADKLLRITVTSQKLVAPCRDALKRGLRLSGGGLWQAAVLEANVQLPTRFLVDRGLSGGCWLEVPAGSYQVRSALERKSTACLEADAQAGALVAHRAEGQWIGLPPLRVLALHLSLVGGGGASGTEARRVAAAAAVLQIHGHEAPQHRAAWVVSSDPATLADPDVAWLRVASGAFGGGGAVSGDAPVELFALASEAELLLHIRDYLVEADADVLVGYDLLGVHLGSLVERAEALGLAKCGHTYGLGRMLGVTSKAKSATFETKQLGKHETKEINVDGRVLFDVLTVIEREKKLSSYSLSALTQEFLGESRLELRMSRVGRLSEERPELLASMALRDAGLSLRLFERQHVLFRYVEMARVTGVTIEYLLTRGQSVKVFSMLLRKAREHKYVLPPPPSGGNGADSSYEGGYVLTPEVGFYEEPVVTLDFASLYPSIMQRHNLCYSTLLQHGDPEPSAQRGKPGFEVVPTLGHRFVTTEVRRGLIPMVLQELLSARAKAKKDLKAATDPQTRAVLDGRQLALKISANSVYGFTGMSMGPLPCQAIAASVTAYGRQMIDRTRVVVEERFCKSRGYPRDAHVIYGDTDSVMITLGKDCDVQQAFAFGKEAAEVVSGEFGTPVKMEFEKVYSPYLLMNKKRYAGVAWAQPGEPGKLDAKGIETVRRDWCPLVRELVERCLQLILREHSVERAVAYVHETIAELRQGKIDPAQLVLSKALVRDGAQAYEAKQAHVELAERIRRRSPEMAPQVGDRVPYVFVAAAQGTPAYDRAEDPLWALERGLPLDAEYYVDHQLTRPLLRIFEHVLPGEAAARHRLFGGEAAHRLAVRAPAGSGPLAAFAQARAKCLGCRAVLHSSDRVLCPGCAAPERAAELLLSQLAAVRPLEAEAARLLSGCGRCEGSLLRGLHAECANVDCPIFFRRLQVSRELDAAQGALEKLRLDW